MFVRIEGMLNCSTNKQQVKVFVGSNVHGTVPDYDSGQMTSATGGIACDHFSIGIHNAATAIIHFDDIAIDNSAFPGSVVQQALAVNAGVDQTVAAASTVTLSATASGGTGAYTYTWTQTAGSPLVTLATPNAASTTFKAPTVVGGTALTFQVTATDTGNNQTVTDTVVINVNAAVTGRFFTEYFESGASGAAISTANTAFSVCSAGATFSSAITPPQGTSSAFFSTGATATNQFGSYNFTAPAPLFARFYVYLPALPSSIIYVASYTSGATQLGAVRINTDGTVSVRNGVVAVYTSAKALLANRWYRMEVRVDANASQQQLRVFSGSNLEGTTPDFDSGNLTYTGVAPTTYATGFTTAAANVSMYLDAVALANDTWIGPTANPNILNAPPTCSAGSNQTTIEPWTTVTLTGTDSSANGSIVSRQWTQTAGTPVTLIGNANASATYIAPPTLMGDTSTFKYTVTDNLNVSMSSTVQNTTLAATERAVIGGVEVPARLIHAHGTSNKMLLGADEPTATSYAAWTNRTAAIGNMGIRRSYDSSSTSISASLAASSAGPTVGHNIVNWLSMHPNATTLLSGGFDTALINFCQSIPSNEYVMLTFNHEPESSVATMPASQFVQAFQYFYTLVKAHTGSNVKVGPILMGYTWDPTSGRNPQNWNPGAAYCDFFGVDFYNPYHYPQTGNSSNWVNPVIPSVVSFTNFCNAMGVQPAIGEFGTSEDATGVGAQRKIDWINGHINYAQANNYLAVCYFDNYRKNADGTNDTDPSIVLDSTPQCAANWSSQCAAYPARSFPAPAPKLRGNTMGLSIPGGMMQSSTALTDQLLNDAVTLGAKWIRTDMNWAWIEGTQGSPNWYWPDYIQSACQSRGLSILWTIGTTPTWARPAGQPEIYGPTSATEQTNFATFCATVVNRYKGYNKYWEIWNEANLDQFWAPTPSASSYATLLQKAYNSIKGADSTSFVLSSGTGGSGSSPDISADTWYTNLYAAGAKPYFDIACCHPYMDPASAAAGSFNSGEMLKANTIRGTMNSNGDSAKPLWATEIGLPTSGATSVTEAQQNTGMAGGRDLWFARETNTKFFIYTLMDDKAYTDTGTTREDFFGIEKNNQTHKPAFDAMKAWIAAG
jgi:hypothetical protein